MEKQLKDVFSTVENYSQRNENFRSENAQLLNKFADMRHQYDLELQGMRIQLYDMRVHVATMMNGHEVKTLHLKKQQETTISNMERELERKRDNTAKARRTYEERIAEKEETIIRLQKELNMVVTERDNAEVKISLQNAKLRERMTELDELYNSIEMKRTQKREVASQMVEEFQDNMKPQETHFSERSEQSYVQMVLSSTHHNHLYTVPSAELISLQEDYREIEQNVAKLCVVRDELMKECDKAHYQDITTKG
ncbi:hypothetical protein LSM04_008234 [Trypanosoma melophagium]|uniref:uncharacterized protein n=1 Tax=Trypanosoma melophagium TaxID=715481 RepID=UPI003519DE58|nr:hypothetical protein LSM04_008234 [Trypanosoma melophagium]